MEEGTIFQAGQQPESNRPPQPIGPSFPPVPPVNPVYNPPLTPVIMPPVAPSVPPPPPVQSPFPPDHGNSRMSKLPFKTLLKLILGLGIVAILLFILFKVILPIFSGNKSNNKVTLTYWGLWEDGNVINPIIADFEKENPNIKINYLKQDPKEYRERLITRMQNGAGPDIFRFHNTWYPMISDILLPLPQETITKNDFYNNYYKAAQNDLVKNGAIYGIPLETDTLALFTNTSLFDSASSEQGSAIALPSTWQEFIDVSVKLTKRDENGKITIAGGGIGTYENVDHAPDIISLLFAQNGVDMSDITNSTGQVSDALTFYTNFALIENNVWDKTLDNSVTAFAKGSLGMFFGYSYDYFTIKGINPNLSFKISPVPQLSPDGKVNIASYWAEGVSAKSKNQKAALLFMKFLAKPDVEEKIYTEESKTRLFGEPYGNKTLAEKLNDAENFVFIDQSTTAVSSPFVDSTYDNGLNDKLDSYLKDSVNAILEGGSADSSTRTLFDGYSQIMQQYGSIKSSQ